MNRLGMRSGVIAQRRLLSFAKLKPDFSKFKIIEQPAGFIVGDVNEPTPKADVDFFHGSYHWSYERLIAISLIPLTVAPFVASVDYPVLDSLLSSIVLIHSHIGLTSCIIDYIPKRVYGIWYTLARRLLLLGTTVGLYGIYQMETNDEGITSLIRRLWEKPDERYVNYYR